MCTPTSTRHAMYVQLATAYDEASKIIGLHDHYIARLLEQRDHYQRLADEQQKIDEREDPPTLSKPTWNENPPDCAPGSELNDPEMYLPD